MTTSEPGKAEARRGLLRAALPHLATAAAAIAASLALQAALAEPPAPPPPQPTVVAPTPAPTAPPATPTEGQPPVAAGITRQELIDLRAQDDRIWAAIYLSRAISQIADAEAALRANDLASVDQVLAAVDASLEQAYARAADADRDPIGQLRRDAGVMREDLYLRPEGLDLRLARLRQTILALIEARR